MSLDANNKAGCRLTIAVLASLWFGVIGSAEVIDRIVAVVDGHIITLSDVRKERELRGQLGDKADRDDRTVARQLVDNYLIEQQLVDYPNIDVTDAEVEADLNKVDSGPGVTSASVRDAIRRRIRMQKYFDLRFRQMISPTTEEIRKYYDDVFMPEAVSRGLQPIPSLTDPGMANAIRQNVIQESLDRQVDTWLGALRGRSKIEIFE